MVLCGSENLCQSISKCKRECNTNAKLTDIRFTKQVTYANGQGFLMTRLSPKHPATTGRRQGNTDLQVTTYNHPMSNKKLAKYQMGILAVRRKPTLEFPWQLVHTSYCWWTNPWTGWYTKCMAFFWRPLSWNMSQVTHCSPPRLEPRIHCGVPLLANQTQDSPRNHRVMNGSLMVWRKMWRIDENSKLWFAVLSMKPSVVKQLLLFTWNDMSKEALCLFLSSKHILIYNHHTYIQTMWIDM